MKKDIFFQLLDRYLAGKASAREEHLLEEYYRRLDEDSRLTLGEEKEMALKRLMLQGIEQRIDRRNRQKRIRLWSAVAATLAILLGAGSLFYLDRQHEIPSTATVQNETLSPGGNRATLTLADGKQVILTGAGNGMLARQGAVAIRKTADGQVVYETESSSAPATDAINKITTPRGGQYQLVLNDGTKVWLNAASSITYPAVFSGSEREVTISGEVYFDVAHNAAKPFKVKAGNQVIEDVGTQFNVNAYSDEADVRTTLVQGAVKIDNVLLHPGQQAITNNGKLNVREVDASEVIAWKDGYFLFQSTSLEEVMKQLSRWYDVEVVYEGKVPDIRFSGGINRQCNASQVLAILEKNNVHFKIQNQKIIVMP